MARGGCHCTGCKAQLHGSFWARSPFALEFATQSCILLNRARIVTVLVNHERGKGAGKWSYQGACTLEFTMLKGKDPVAWVPAAPNQGRQRQGIPQVHLARNQHHSLFAVQAHVVNPETDCRTPTFAIHAGQVRCLQP